MNIRNYKHSDYLMIRKWWESTGQPVPGPELMNEQTTFILEDNIPAYSLTALITNCKEISYLENFIKNPKYKGNKSKEIVDYVCNFLKFIGYKRALAFAHNKKLEEIYTKIGLVKTLDGLSCLKKEF